MKICGYWQNYLHHEEAHVGDALMMNHRDTKTSENSLITIHDVSSVEKSLSKTGHISNQSDFQNAKNLFLPEFIMGVIFVPRIFIVPFKMQSKISEIFSSKFWWAQQQGRM